MPLSGIYLPQHISLAKNTQDLSFSVPSCRQTVSYVCVFLPYLHLLTQNKNGVNNSTTLVCIMYLVNTWSRRVHCSCKHRKVYYKLPAASEYLLSPAEVCSLTFIRERRGSEGGVTTSLAPAASRSTGPGRRRERSRCCCAANKRLVSELGGVSYINGQHTA